MDSVRTYWLSMHAAYACRHAGACCSSGWPIPIERHRAAVVRMLRPDGTWLQPVASAPEEVAGVLALAPDGRCVFHEHGCRIQQAFGHDAIPSACQHFPREVLIDGRGVFVTLSHYCPTALELLFDHDGDVEIIEGPPAVPTGEPEGLDARDVLPPLLTRDVLMDLPAYGAWEEHMVRELSARDERTPEAVLEVLERDLAVVEKWRPGQRALIDEVRALERRPVEQAGWGSRDGMIVRRYLAARAFASWMAYEAGSVRAVLRSLRLALRTVREHQSRLSLRESIRQADLQLLHLMPREQLAARCR